jgi:hypothetical protein
VGVSKFAGDPLSWTKLAAAQCPSIFTLCNTRVIDIRLDWESMSVHY